LRSKYHTASSTECSAEVSDNVDAISCLSIRIIDTAA